MFYLSTHRHQLQVTPTDSLFAPVLAGPDAAYRIHLVAANDPAYLPADFEVWPIYYRSIVETLRRFPDAHDATVEAVRQKREELRGLQNREIPPGSRPRY